MINRRDLPHPWSICRGETRAPGAVLPGAVAPVGAVFGGSCHVLALRAGRVSTVSIVYDTAAGQLAAWKCPRTDDASSLAAFRRAAERWAAGDMLDGAAEPYGLRVWNDRTYLVQELLPRLHLAEALLLPGQSWHHLTRGLLGICRTAQEMAEHGFTAPGILHVWNVHAESLGDLWLTDPTTSALGARARSGDLVAAAGRVIQCAFGMIGAPCEAVRTRWKETPAAVRSGVQRLVRQCAPDASVRFTHLAAVADALGDLLRHARADGGPTPPFGVHAPRFSPEYQDSVYLGYQFLHFGCFEWAEGAFRRALGHAPWSPDARLGLAEALLYTDAADEALRLTQGVVGDHPEEARAWQVYARAQLLFDEELDGALQAAEQARRLAPSDPAAALTHAQILELSGREGEAAALREEAMGLAPHWAEPAIASGFLALECGDHPTAARCFLRALRANPLELEAWQGHALALEYHDRYAKAARSVQQLAAVQPQSEEFAAWWRRLQLFGERPDVAAARGARAAQQALDSVPAIPSGHTPETRTGLETALGALEHALHLRPDAVALWCLKGELHAALEGPFEAGWCFARATELDGESGAAWHGLARALLALGREREGADCLQQAMTVRRPMPAAGLLNAELDWRQGRRGAALRRLEVTLAMAPAWAPAWQRLAEWGERLGRPRLALRAGEALSELPGHRVRGFVIVARQLARLGAYAEAEDMCRRALELDDAPPDGWLMLAELHHARGATAQARHSLEQALARDSQRADVWCLYARTLLADGDIRSAGAVARRATRLASESAEAWYVAAEVHFRAGETLAARRAYGRAIKLAPRDAASWGGLADVLLASGRARASLVAAERAVALDPDCADHWCMLGRAQLARGFTHPAAQSFDRAISLAPEHVAAWHLLAVTEVVLGRLNAAQRNWMRVLALAPDHTAAQEALRRLRRLRHRGTRVQTALHDVLMDLPGSPPLALGGDPSHSAAGPR